MNNCFKKVLTDIVVGNDCERINTLTLKITSHAEGVTNRISIDGVSRIEIREGGSFLGGSSYVDNPDPSTVYEINITSTPVYIDIIDTYNINALRTYFNDSFDIIGSFKYRTAIRNLTLSKISAFDIDSLKDCTSLRIYDINTLNATAGDIISLGNCINLTELKLFSSNVFGDWNDFIDLQIDNGKTTNTNGITLYNPTVQRITMNGFNISFDAGSSRGKLCWNNGKRYLLCGTSSQWNKVYCVGYSQEEIETNIASGGIWSGISLTNVFNCG